MVHTAYWSFVHELLILTQLENQKIVEKKDKEVEQVKELLAAQEEQRRKAVRMLLFFHDFHMWQCCQF